MKRIIVVLLALGLPSPLPAAPAGRLEVDLTGLRNAKGWVRLCLTGTAAGFPDCSRDPKAWKRNVPARSLGRLTFENLPPGAYAFSAIHDENANEKVDFRLGLPREGVAFSNNAPVRFGPPKYSAARFQVGSGVTRQRVKFRYWL